MVLGSLWTAFTCETFYRQYAIPDSSVQGQRGPITPSTADFQSIFSLESISVYVSQYLRHVVRQLRCFLSLLLLLFRPKQCLHTVRQSVSHAKVGLRGTTFQPDYALITVSKLQTKFDSYSAVPLHIFQLPTAPWETGSSRPSDNLSLHRTMTECFPVTGVCCCFPVTTNTTDCTLSIETRFCFTP